MDLFNLLAVKISLTCAGIFFLSGLLTGLWKYVKIRQSPTSEAPHYVNIAHRASLMYAFAAQLLAAFSSYNAFSDKVVSISISFPLIFFAFAILHYVHLGFTTESRNSIRDAQDKSKDFMVLNLLTIAEIGGFSVLFIGFLLRIF